MPFQIFNIFVKYSVVTYKNIIFDLITKILLVMDIGFLQYRLIEFWGII